MKLLLCFLLSATAPSSPGDTVPPANNPGALFVIRGRVVDSSVMTGVKVKKMKPLTGEKAISLYGERAKDGVVFVELEDETYNVMGLVKDKKGKPLSNVTIIAEGETQRASSDACGHFHLRGVKAGTRLTIRKTGYSDQFLDVYKQPDDLLEIRLSKK